MGNVPTEPQHQDIVDNSNHFKPHQHNGTHQGVQRPEKKDIQRKIHGQEVRNQKEVHKLGSGNRTDKQTDHGGGHVKPHVDNGMSAAHGTDHDRHCTVTDVKEALDGVDKIVKEWREIISNTTSNENVTGEQIAFIRYRMEETGHEWNRMSEKISRKNNSGALGNQLGKHESNTDKQMQSMQTIIQDLSQQLIEYKTRFESMDLERIQHLEKIRQLEEKNEELLNRVSKEASDRLLSNNPHIADLSDANRPTKLGEVYSELYDNEYTEALVALVEHGYTEMESIDTLRETLMNTFQFCSEKATALLTTTEDAINTLFDNDARQHQQPKVETERSPSTTRATASTLRPGKGMQIFRERTDIDDLKFALKWKPKNTNNTDGASLSSKQDQTEIKSEKIQKLEDQMKIMIKEVACAIVPLVLKAYLRTRWDNDCIAELMPFIERCIFVSWIMNVQSPPMAFLPVTNGPDEPFDGGRYREYTKSGALLDYVVWPAMMLTKDGPIIVKGVAQGKN